MPEPLIESFDSLEEVASRFRAILDEKKFILLYAYNGTGKTRLSMAFKDSDRRGDDRDTLYYNAFTEDLFTWDNDLDGDSERVLCINSESHFFDGLEELEMENRIRPFLQNPGNSSDSSSAPHWQTWVDGSAVCRNLSPPAVG